MNTDSKAKWKHSDDRVTVGKTLSRGRFAEIKEGKLKDVTGTRNIAVKMLLGRLILLLRQREIISL